MAARLDSLLRLLWSVPLSVDQAIADTLAQIAARGITIVRGPDADRHLASIPARAAYVPVEGEPGIVILSGDATYADVKHEEFHTRQHEARGWRAWDSSEQALVEVLAHRNVIDHADEWSLSEQERAEHMSLLEYWEGRLT